jgi:hypothetical protein
MHIATVIEHKCKARVGYPQFLTGQLIELMLEFVAVIIIMEGKLYLCVLSLELEVDEQISRTLVDPILDPEDIAPVDLLEPLVGFLQVEDRPVGALASNPVVEFYFEAADVTVYYPVEVFKHWQVVVVVEVTVHLPGLLSLREEGVQHFRHDPQVCLRPSEFIASDEFISAILLQDQLHLLVELIRNLPGPQAQLFYPVSKALLALILHICEQIRVGLTADCHDRSRNLLHLSNRIGFTRPLEVLSNHFLRFKKSLPFSHSLGKPA